MTTNINTEANTEAPPAESNLAADAAGWRANAALVERWMQECRYEYTSKERMRRLALTAFASLHAIYTMQAQVAEQMAQEQQASSLIIPSTEIVKP